MRDKDEIIGVRREDCDEIQKDVLTAHGVINVCACLRILLWQEFFQMLRL